MHKMECAIGVLIGAAMGISIYGCHSSSQATGTMNPSSSRFAYVANNASKDISMYTINTTTGILTFTGTISAGTVAFGTGPESVTADPSGKFVYVPNSGALTSRCIASTPPREP
jgi:DNA-binding beta-propeller fold protein YncE